MCAAHLLAQAAVGRGDQPHVDRDVVVGADAPDLAPLEHAQQLGLQVDGQLADLVEEHRAAVGRLEHALARRHGARERAALVAEQLALQQVGRHRAAVDDQERLVAARAAVVNRLGGDLLAGAGLALQQDGGLAARRLAEHVEHRLHGGRAPDHAPEAIVDRAAARRVRGFQAYRYAAGKRGARTVGTRRHHPGASTISGPPLTAEGLVSSGNYTPRCVRGRM